MKSKLFKAVFGIGLFALALNVNANTINSVTDGSNTTDATVTVGEVAVPVYEVVVSWDNLTFDWTYDYETEKFGWKPADVCSPSEVYTSDEFNEYYGQLYEDADCTIEATEYTEREETGCDADGNCGGVFIPYYHFAQRNSVDIHIRDYSENGQIVPSIKWNASSEYKDVVGKFQHRERGEDGIVLAGKCTLIENQEIFDTVVWGDAWNKISLYNDSACSSQLEDIPTTFEENKYYANVYPLVDLITEEIPDTSADYLWKSSYFNEYDMLYHVGDYAKESRDYTVTFNLEGGSTTPTAGDEIGTITVSIRAK